MTTAQQSTGTGTGTQTEPPLPELFQRPPVFTDPLRERRHRILRLTATLRLFAQFGYEEGLAGHITVCDPVIPDAFWANPMGVPFDYVTPGDLVLVDADGTTIQGSHSINLGAFNIHVQVHLARPDVICVAHTHSIHGRAFSALGIPLAPITQDACPFFEDHAVFEDYTGIVLDGTDGRRIAATLGSGKAIILRNHGLLTVGHSVDEAAWWFITMERSCQAQLLASAAGNPVLIEPEMAKLTASQVGSHVSGYLSFQPLYEKIVREQPDLLD